MNMNPPIQPFEAGFNTPSKRMLAFDNAVRDYAIARSNLAGLAALIAMQDAAPDPVQRERLSKLSAEHFLTGETVKAMSMTLSGDQLLKQAAELLDDGMGGWM